MKRSNSPWRPVQSAELRWSDPDAPVSAAYGDVYYSVDDGLAESRHVFLDGNDLPRRWREHAHPHFCIGELGFGTGLNFLLAWQAWRELGTPRPDLHYLSIEKHPLTARDLARALTAWPALGELATTLLDAYPGPLPGQHRILLEDGRVRLDLWWEDVALALPDLASRAQPLVDAWYLDGFAPARNSDMWAPDVLRAVAALSRPHASFATFTAAGHVRRSLADAGFNVSKVPGHGRKRECLRGVLETHPGPLAGFSYTPWDVPALAQPRPRSALIVGGGLAGCTMAAALARRGIEVTVLEQGPLAGAASGNDQGILYTRLSRRHGALVDFAVQSFQFAANLYRDLFTAGALRAPLDGALCGSFQQSEDDAEMAGLAEVLHGLEEFAQVLNREEANSVLGIEQHRSGYWYPRAGWLHPAAVCRALLARYKITVIEHCGPVELQASHACWRAIAGGKSIASADCAIAACGTGIRNMPQLEWLPLQAIRGQTTQVPSTAAFQQLRAVLSHEGYIAPARALRHCIGATFDLRVRESTPRIGDNVTNLARLADAVPTWRKSLESLDAGSLESRVGFRCASADQMPVVGPVPNRDGFLDLYGALRKNARASIGAAGEYIPGLYISAAHGSRGLTSTPLAAEVIASMICAEPPPLGRELCRALSPGRFIIRDLSRNRV
jgi:tRNA 5-methylaminomethyl-2-thiouridine biosynthesis bifunctional protein